jgi:hypothetical protein
VERQLEDFYFIIACPVVAFHLVLNLHTCCIFVLRRFYILVGVFVSCDPIYPWDSSYLSNITTTERETRLR